MLFWPLFDIPHRIPTVLSYLVVHNMAVWGAAEATLDTLRELEMEDVCFIGGLAAKLYGNEREPNVSVGSTAYTLFAESSPFY
jgi:hypothetical protein